LRLEDERIEPGQQLCCDDDDLQWVSQIIESCCNLLKVISIRRPLRPGGGIGALLTSRWCGCLRREQGVDSLLLGDAGCLVVGDKLRLEAHGLDLRREMLDNVSRYLFDVLQRFDEHLDRRGFLRQGDLLALAQASIGCELFKRGVDLVLAEVNLRQAWLEVQGQVAPSRMEFWKEYRER